jgi:hypothetical protein
MLPPFHELLVDDLAGIVLAGLDVDRLFNDSIRPATERLACAILCAVSRDHRRIEGRYEPGMAPLRSASMEATLRVVRVAGKGWMSGGSKKRGQREERRNQIILSI